MNYSVKIILSVLIIIMHYSMLVINSLKYLQLINATHQIFLSTPSSLWEYMARYSHLTLLWTAFLHSHHATFNKMTCYHYNVHKKQINDIIGTKILIQFAQQNHKYKKQILSLAHDLRYDNNLSQCQSSRQWKLRKLLPEHDAAIKENKPLQFSQHKPNKGGERERKNFHKSLCPFPNPPPPKNVDSQRKTLKKLNN